MMALAREVIAAIAQRVLGDIKGPDPIALGSCYVVKIGADGRDVRCQQSSRGKTVMSFACCDECFDHIRDEGGPGGPTNG